VRPWLALAAALLVALPATAGPSRDPRQAALDYLATLPAEAQTQLAPYLVEAAVANHLDPRQWPGGHAALATVGDPGNATLQPQIRPLYALAIAGAPLGNRADRVLGWFNNGQFGDAQLRNDDAWALLALHAAHRGGARMDEAARNLAAAQDASGGWAWTVGGAPDVDTTGMVLEALAANAALTPDAAGRARQWLNGAANATGGFPAQPGKAPNCDSTAWAMRGLWAAGARDNATTSAVRFLQVLQNPDGGIALAPGNVSNPLCTAEAATVLGMVWQRSPLGSSTSTHRDGPGLEGWAGVAAVAAVALIRRRG